MSSAGPAAVRNVHRPAVRWAVQPSGAVQDFTVHAANGRAIRTAPIGAVEPVFLTVSVYTVPVESPRYCWVGLSEAGAANGAPSADVGRTATATTATRVAMVASRRGPRLTRETGETTVRAATAMRGPLPTWLGSRRNGRIPARRVSQPGVTSGYPPRQWTFRPIVPCDPARLS